jgi:hypothetical protein
MVVRLFTKFLMIWIQKQNRTTALATRHWGWTVNPRITVAACVANDRRDVCVICFWNEEVRAWTWPQKQVALLSMRRASQQCAVLPLCGPPFWGSDRTFRSPHTEHRPMETRTWDYKPLPSQFNNKKTSYTQVRRTFNGDVITLVKFEIVKNTAKIVKR